MFVPLLQNLRNLYCQSAVQLHRDGGGGNPHPFYPGPEVEASKRDLPHALTPMPSDPRPFCLPEIFLNLYMLKNVDRNLCYLRHLHICLLTRICIPEINAVFRNLL